MMIWEIGIETCALSYVKQISSPGSMHETGCSGPVHWDDPEGWDGEGGGGFNPGFPSILKKSHWHIVVLHVVFNFCCTTK